jgi:hypothetical protein
MSIEEAHKTLFLYIFRTWEITRAKQKTLKALQGTTLNFQVKEL